MAKWFHPTLFVDLDPEASLLPELHERFLPVPYEQTAEPQAMTRTTAAGPAQRLILCALAVLLLGGVLLDLALGPARYSLSEVLGALLSPNSAARKCAW